MNWYKKALKGGYPSDMKRRMPETERQIYDYYYSDDPPVGEPMAEEFWDQYHLSPEQKVKNIFVSKTHPLSGEPWDIREFNKIEQTMINERITKGLKKIKRDNKKIDDFSSPDYLEFFYFIPKEYIIEINNKLNIL